MRCRARSCPEVRGPGPQQKIQTCSLSDRGCSADVCESPIQVRANPLRTSSLGESSSVRVWCIRRNGIQYSPGGNCAEPDPGCWSQVAVLLARSARICQVWASYSLCHWSMLFLPTFPLKNNDYHWITCGPTGNCPKFCVVSVTLLPALKAACLLYFYK